MIMAQSNEDDKFNNCEKTRLFYDLRLTGTWIVYSNQRPITNHHFSDLHASFCLGREHFSDRRQNLVDWYPTKPLSDTHDTPAINMSHISIQATNGAGFWHVCQEGNAKSGRDQSGPGVLGWHATTAVLGKGVVHEQVDYLEDRQHARTEQQADKVAQNGPTRLNIV